ncbi:MAG: hypothetical protein U9R16_06720 [Campylobacterota bacterium]|nr:hypothetical protein [Campylobacterota bacterium]
MFQKTIVKIIKRLENLTQIKKSIIELDIDDIRDEIQETLYKIDFTQDTIEDSDINELKELNVTEKQALGLFFLTFATTLRDEISYSGLWNGIVDALMEYEEDNNTFFIDNYFEDNSEPNSYLNEAINEAIIRFDLRYCCDKGKPTDTVLLQMGILNRFNNLNYWLCSTSKQSTVEELTNRTNSNFSTTFNSGWKVLQRYSQSIVSKKEAKDILEQNVWFKGFDMENLLNSSKIKLNSIFISRDEIEDAFFLDSVRLEDKKLQFTIDGDDFYALNLNDTNYDIFIDDKFETKLIKDDKTDIFNLEKKITVIEPQNYKIKIEIKDSYGVVLFFQEFVLFDFNHDIMIFDQDGKWSKDINKKLDVSKKYSLLLDSDFETNIDDENIYEYFDGYVNLITNITKESEFNGDDGDEYQFGLNFDKDIKPPVWLNNIELYGSSDFLSFEEPLEYRLRYNKLAISARQKDELVDIEQNISIVRWSYCGGVVYDLDNIKQFNYDMDLTYDILMNRKNTIKIKIDDVIYTKQLNVTIVEKTAKPKYRTFLRDIDDNIIFLNKNNNLSSSDIKNNKMIITSFHEEFITQPELKKEIIRDKSTILENIELNKFINLKNYPYYAEEISNVKKIYDDVRWNTICNIRKQGIVNSYDKDSLVVTLSNDDISSSLTLITLDKNYALKSSQIDIANNEIEIPLNLFGFCLVEEGDYIGSYFIDTKLDIETIFSSVEILKFLRVSYFPFGEYFNGTEYEKNRALREKARDDKKKDKREIRSCIKNRPTIFLKAFIEDQLDIDDISVNLNFEHSKSIVEQILFAIEFDGEEAVKIIHEVILNRWQDKFIKIPIFLIYLLNIVKNDRYYNIFLDELEESIDEPIDVNEEFCERMVKALLSDHKIDRYEKINIKTITQLENRDFYTKKALNRLIDISSMLIEDESDDEIES